MVPFMYLVYRSTPVTVSAQTVVAHATSLGVAFVTSTFATWRYSRVKAVAWQAAAAYAVPGSFRVPGRSVLTKVHEAHGYGPRSEGSRWCRRWTWPGGP
jgi:uncharacterized membrane protein YfcA